MKPVRSLPQVIEMLQIEKELKGKKENPCQYIH